MNAEAPKLPGLPPGTWFTVFGPLLAMALLFVTLMFTPPGGPIGGTWSVACLLGAGVLAAVTVRWLSRLPRPIALLHWLAAMPALLLFVLLGGLSLALALGAGGA